jgi:folate-binding protein YgfZ
MKDFLNKGLILDTHKGFKQVLEETLKKYSFRRAVEISDMNSKFQVSSVFSNDSSLNLSKHVTGSVLAFEDPRNPSLGWRRLDYKENISEVNEDEEKEFKVWRIFHGVPEGPAIQNQIPHHLNFQYLNSISLNKGCYVGQELIARTSTQGVVRTGIFSFVVGKNFMGWENIDWKLKDLTSAKVFNRNGEQVGVVLESVGNVGLVKGKYADFEEECFLEGGEKINIVKPSYFRVD